MSLQGSYINSGGNLKVVFLRLFVDLRLELPDVPHDIHLSLIFAVVEPSDKLNREAAVEHSLLPLGL